MEVLSVHGEPHGGSLYRMEGEAPAWSFDFETVRELVDGLDRAILAAAEQRGCPLPLPL